MEVRRVELIDVRAWRKLNLEVNGSTAFIGGNGTGKTTVLESLYYAATLSSHRTSSDQAMVHRDAERAVIRATVALPREQTVELEIVTKGRARAQLGGAPVSSRREVLGVLRVSLFAPERVEVVRGDPSKRRAFADELLTMAYPRYHVTLRDYEKVLRQRNRLLRAIADGESSDAGLEAWDMALLPLAAEICEGRERAIATLAPMAAEAYQQVAGGDLVVAYEPRCEHSGASASRQEWQNALANKLEERRSLERIRGTTLFGPHRDDLGITVDDLPARSHASHGEGWLVALSLSLAAHRSITQASGEPPVLLLDDPFTLLDPQRRQRLAASLPEGQVLVTAADPAEVPESMPVERVDASLIRGET